MLTVAPRYHGLVQPPGARMILIRLRGTTSCSGGPSRSMAYGLTSKWTRALRAALASAIREMRPRRAARSPRTAQTTTSYRYSSPWPLERAKTLILQGFSGERATRIEPALPTRKASGTPSRLSVNIRADLRIPVFDLDRWWSVLGPKFTGRTAPLRPRLARLWSSVVATGLTRNRGLLGRRAILLWRDLDVRLWSRVWYYA